ncbi:MAG: hypothetical protein R3C11_00615 [Planctomycetaceae bacterium]
MPKQSFTHPEFLTAHSGSQATSATETNKRAGTALVMLGYPTVSALNKKDHATIDVVKPISPAV